MKGTSNNMLFILFFLVFFSACEKDTRMRNKFLGTWDIALYQRDLITQDSTEVVYSKENAGNITFTNPFGGKSGKELDFSGTVQNENGTQALQGSGQIDDEATRWIIYYGKCNDLIGCDLAYTVTKCTQHRIEMFTISATNQPGKHYKLTMVLRK